MTTGRTVLGLTLAAAAVIAALWSIIPFPVWWGDTEPAVLAGAWWTWVWGGAVVLGITVVVMVLSRGRAPAWLLVAWGRTAGRASTGRMLVIASIALVTAAGLVFVLLFEGNPRSVDGFAQLFHARMFLAGRLWVEPPAELANFATLHMLLGPERWYSQYPPGQPAVLAIGLAAGLWWLLQPLFAVLLVLATWRVAVWVADKTTARLTVVLMVLSPFLVAVTATELSHIPAAALAMGAAAAATMLDRPSWTRWAPAAGLALGLMVAFRPLDAMAAAVPVGVVTLLTARGRVVPALALMAVGGVLGTIPTLWFNAGTTGSWHEFGYERLWGAGIALGFHEVPWSQPLTFRRAVALTAFDFHQLNMYLLDFPIPVLLLAAGGFLAGHRQLRHRDAVPFVAVGSLMGLLFFYFHRDTFYGPRQLFSVVPWFLLLFARALVVLRRAGAPTAAGVPSGMVAVTGCAVGLAVGLATIAPDRLLAFRQSTAVLNHHPDRDAAGLEQAVVLIPDGWGSRLIARMWEAGVPVPRSTGLYAAIDACTLELVLDAADDPAVRATLLPRLEALAARGQPGVRLDRTDDAALRLPRPGPLPPACEAEIAFDQAGFLAFAPYLYLNTAALDGPIVWARDLRDRNDALRRRYPERAFFRYAPPERGAAPRLVPLPDATPRAPGP